MSNSGGRDHQGGDDDPHPRRRIAQEYNRLVAEVAGQQERCEASRGGRTDFWATREIAGVALVDVAVWHWMYEHPDAPSEHLRDATERIAEETWARWYQPVIGKTRGASPQLGSYSHLIANPL